MPQQVLIMGAAIETKTPVMLTWVKVHDQKARRPNKTISFTDAIEMLLKRGYTIAEHIQEEGIYQTQLTLNAA